MRTIIYAPNVHVGGGAVLLRDLLSVKCTSITNIFCDARFPIERRDFCIYKVRNNFFSRFISEFKLFFLAGREDTVLCFNGLPPLLPNRGKVFIFLQNRLLLTGAGSYGFSVGARCRIFIGRAWLKAIRSSRFKYIVQTPSMREALLEKGFPSASVVLAPFLPANRFLLPEERSINYDFVYVASGEPHKNHTRLLQAWCYLARHGVRPSLALTVDPLRYKSLASEIDVLKKLFNLKLENLGVLSSSEICSLYSTSGALIYPSLSESFGMPLLEAMEFGLPIVASELDYVRDVVVPAETFNPLSKVSIARSVLRYLDCAVPVVPIVTAEEFLNSLSQ